MIRSPFEVTFHKTPFVVQFLLLKICFLNVQAPESGLRLFMLTLNLTKQHFMVADKTFQRLENPNLLSKVPGQVMK